MNIVEPGLSFKRELWAQTFVMFNVLAKYDTRSEFYLADWSAITNILKPPT